MIGGGFRVEQTKPRPKSMYAVAEWRWRGSNHAAILS